MLQQLQQLMPPPQPRPPPPAAMEFNDQLRRRGLGKRTLDNFLQSSAEQEGSKRVLREDEILCQHAQLQQLQQPPSQAPQPPRLQPAAEIDNKQDELRRAERQSSAERQLLYERQQAVQQLLHEEFERTFGPNGQSTESRGVPATDEMLQQRALQRHLWQAPQASPPLLGMSLPFGDARAARIGAFHAEIEQKSYAASAARALANARAARVNVLAEVRRKDYDEAAASRARASAALGMVRADASAAGASGDAGARARAQPHASRGLGSGVIFPVDPRVLQPPSERATPPGSTQLVQPGQRTSQNGAGIRSNGSGAAADSPPFGSPPASSGATAPSSADRRANGALPQTLSLAAIRLETVRGPTAAPGAAQQSPQRGSASALSVHGQGIGQANCVATSPGYVSRSDPPQRRDAGGPPGGT